MNVKGSKRPAADVFSLGMSVFELAWDVDLVGRGEVWSQLRTGVLPAINPALGRSDALVALIRKVHRLVFRWR